MFDRFFGNFEGYRRALEIAGSPNVGICLCCGTWLEGGKALTGKDPEEMIRYFGAGKIWKIHFRNASAPLPHFVDIGSFARDGGRGLHAGGLWVRVYAGVSASG